MGVSNEQGPGGSIGTSPRWSARFAGFATPVNRRDLALWIVRSTYDLDFQREA
jgi:hypothetical protein